MTPSPELIQELRASRPTAPADLRMRVREIAARDAVAPTALAKLRLRLPQRRHLLVALPAAMALALATAGVLGLARSDAPTTEAVELEAIDKATPESATPPATTFGGTDQGPRSGGAPDSTRAQRTSAILTVEVTDSDGVSEAAQKALDLSRRLGGHVVSASVVTGDGANAAITLRVPSERVQEAVVQLSALGDIVTQQVTIDDLQATIDQLERRERSLRAQIATLVARLESEPLDAETRARLEARLQNLRAELRTLRGDLSGTRAEARMATISLTVVTPESRGEAVPPPSKLDDALDEALTILVWEGVVALVILIVAAPFALAALVVWFGRRLYRRREEDRLLAT
jgi:Domain of unknown function (DUF4349)